MPGKIFISYRRKDVPGEAGRVHDELARKFRKRSIFMDVNKLHAGQLFDEELAKALAASDVLLAIIGPRWMDLLKAKSASDKRDYVRVEIAQALKRQIVVIPVRVGSEGQMPPLPLPEELPDDIRDMVRYQNHDVMNERFGRDMAKLIEDIDFVRGRGSGLRPTVLGLLAAGAVVAVAVTWAAAAYQAGVPIPWSSSSVPVPTAVSKSPGAIREVQAETAYSKKAEDEARNAAEAKHRAEEVAAEQRKSEEDQELAEAVRSWTGLAKNSPQQQVQPPGIAGACYTNMGTCPMAVPIYQGSFCYCPSAWGPISGVAR
jgi:hypothetical protein